VEANLGYESEHHERALRGLRQVRFYQDVRRGRVGVCTTHAIKHACVTMLNTMLREKRVSVQPASVFISKDGVILKGKLRDQLQIYSYQFKTAATVFGSQKMALSGKVGGMKDDMCISLQMCIYHATMSFKV
jgi:hypothetical protein